MQGGLCLQNSSVSQESGVQTWHAMESIIYMCAMLDRHTNDDMSITSIQSHAASSTNWMFSSTSQSYALQHIKIKSGGQPAIRASMSELHSLYAIEWTAFQACFRAGADGCNGGWLSSALSWRTLDISLRCCEASVKPTVASCCHQLHILKTLVSQIPTSHSRVIDLQSANAPMVAPYLLAASHHTFSVTRAAVWGLLRVGSQEYASSTFRGYERDPLMPALPCDHPMSDAHGLMCTNKIWLGPRLQAFLGQSETTACEVLAHSPGTFIIPWRNWRPWEACQ